MSNTEIKTKIAKVKSHVMNMNTRVHIGGYGLSVEPIKIALVGILDILEDMNRDMEANQATQPNPKV